MTTSRLRQQSKFKVDVKDLKRVDCRYDDYYIPAGGAYIVPICLRKIDAWRSALDTCAIDENVYLTAHDVKSPLKDFFHSLKVCQVAIDHFDFDAEWLPNSVQRAKNDSRSY
jgi:hypothetical protein